MAHRDALAFEAGGRHTDRKGEEANRGQEGVVVYNPSPKDYSVGAPIPVASPFDVWGAIWDPPTSDWLAWARDRNCLLYQGFEQDAENIRQYFATAIREAVAVRAASERD